MRQRKNYEAETSRLSLSKEKVHTSVASEAAIDTVAVRVSGWKALGCQPMRPESHAQAALRVRRARRRGGVKGSGECRTLPLLASDHLERMCVLLGRIHDGSGRKKKLLRSLFFTVSIILGLVPCFIIHRYSFRSLDPLPSWYFRIGDRSMQL